MSTIVDMRLRPPLPGWRDTPLFRPGTTSSTWHPDYPRPASADSLQPEDLIAEMDEAGIALGVIMGRQSGGGLGSTSNDDIADWIARFPGRFVGWAGVDVAAPMDEIVAETRRCLALPYFKGVSIEPSIAPGFTGAADQRLYPLFDECQRQGVPLSITLSSILQSSVKAPLAHSAPGQVYEVALAFPKLAIHVAHAAWPWVMDMIGVAFACRNVWLSPDQYLVPTLPGAQDYAKAALEYFAERTLFGTAYPFKPLPQMVAAYRSWNWPPEIERKILGDNALRLMNMR
jgi:predicted TIM-barrel fold metal-dependent hydrolase